MNFASLWTESASTMEKVIIAMALGGIISSLVMMYHKRVIGKYVRALLATDAKDAESAIRVDAIAGTKTPFARALRSPGNPLRRVVTVVDRDGARLKADELASARIYIADESRFAAEERYSAKNANWPVVAVGALLILAVAYACIRFIPEILSLKLFD